MMLRTCLGVLAVGICVLAGCSQSEMSVASQKQSNWLDVDRSALSLAGDPPPPKILPETHFAAARLLEGQGQFEKALAQYRRATLLNHEFVAAYHRLGLLLGRLGRHSEAVKALERAVEIRPDIAIFHNNLGFEYALMERWEAAEPALRCAVDLQRNFARAQINLGMVLSRLDRFDEAYEAFAAALPKSAAHYNLGLMYRSQEMNHDAALAFIHAIELDPGLIAASMHLDQVVGLLGTVSLTEPMVQVLYEPEATGVSPVKTPTLADPPGDNRPLPSADVEPDDTEPAEGPIMIEPGTSAEASPGQSIEPTDQTAVEPVEPADVWLDEAEWIDETEEETSPESASLTGYDDNVLPPVDDTEWHAVEAELETVWQELVQAIEQRWSSDSAGDVYVKPNADSPAQPGTTAATISEPPLLLLDPTLTVQTNGAAGENEPVLPPARIRPVKRLSTERTARIENPTPQM